MTPLHHQPSLTVDVALFMLAHERLRILLVERANPPFAGRWALPGGFIELEETLEESARRELAEETGVRDVFLEQLYAFGDPGRDPRGRTVTIAYLGLTGGGGPAARAGSDAARAEWFDADRPPSLAFDHELVLSCAREALRDRLLYTPAAAHLLPPTFTLENLVRAYEAAFCRRVQARDLERRLLATGWLETAEAQARPYRFRPRPPPSGGPPGKGLPRLLEPLVSGT
jgi:8-oxo-dGTP diphosphatase